MAGHEEKNHKSANRMERSIRILLIILAAILAILLVFLFAQYQSLRRQQILNARALHWSLLLRNHAPLPQSDANVIRSWMTFDYVNRLFGLPADYFKNQLNITDTHYPRLTISSFAKDAGLDASTTLDEVQSAVREYRSPNTQPPGGGASSTSSARAGVAGHQGV